MSKIPTMEEVMSWPAPNYIDPQTRRPLVFGVQVTLMTLTAVTVAVRFYSRTVIVQALGMVGANFVSRLSH